jgi:hypothetical protein
MASAEEEISMSLVTRTRPSPSMQGIARLNISLIAPVLCSFIFLNVGQQNLQVIAVEWQANYVGNPFQFGGATEPPFRNSMSAATAILV